MTFYEDGEPVEKVKAAFEAGEKGRTAPACGRWLTNGPGGLRCIRPAGHEADYHQYMGNTWLMWPVS